MQIGPVTLDGQHVRLEPVSLAHVPALWRAGAHEEIWRYLPYVMHSEDDMRAYVESELAKQQAGLVVRFTTVARAIAQAIGSTSYLNIDRHHRRVEILATLCHQHRSEIPAAAARLRDPGLHPGGVQDRLAQHQIAPGSGPYWRHRGRHLSQPHGDARWAHPAQRLFRHHQR